MKTRKWLYFLGSYYEVARFAAVAIAILPVFNPFGNAGSRFLLMSLVSPAALFAAALFLLGRDEARFHAYVPLLTLGKGLQVVLSVLYLLAAYGIFNALSVWIPMFAPLAEGYPELRLGAIPPLLSLGTLVLDLLFLLFLLSCKRSPNDR